MRRYSSGTARIRSAARARRGEQQVAAAAGAHQPPVGDVGDVAVRLADRLGAHVAPLARRRPLARLHHPPQHAERVLQTLGGAAHVPTAAGTGQLVELRRAWSGSAAARRAPAAARPCPRPRCRATSGAASSTAFSTASCTVAARRRAAVATALQPQVRHPVVVDAEELDAAGVRAEVRAHPVQRRLDARLGGVGVQVVQQQQVQHELVLGQPPHLRLVQQPDDALQPLAVERDAPRRRDPRRARRSPGPPASPIASSRASMRAGRSRTSAAS